MLFLYLGPIKVVRLHIGWLVSLRLLGEGNCCAYKAEEKTMFKPKKKKNVFEEKLSSKKTIQQQTDRFVDPL